jgi:hypothetical protein
VSIQDALLQAAEELRRQRKIEEYRKDPALWIKDVMGKDLWSLQGEIAKSVVENKRTAVKSSNSVGKSYLAAMLVCWWVSVYPEHKSLAITTASTGPQVHKVLWRYVRQFHAEYGLKGYVTMDSEWKTNDGTLLAFGRKPDGDDVTGFQGYHADFILVIADEAGNIPEPLFAGFEAVTVNDTSRIFAIGNPDVHGSYFHGIFKKPESESVWNRMTISAFDTPAFTGEKVSADIVNNLASPQWVEDRKKEWGEGSPRYQAKVLGEFADQSESTLFSQSTINKGIDTEIEVDDLVPVYLGVDIARFGTDMSVIYENRGGRCRLVASWSYADLVESANRIEKWANELRAVEVRIDGAGIGAGVYDVLNHRQREWQLVGIQGNAQSPDLDKWSNYRAFAYDSLRLKMANGKIDIDPEDTLLQDELGIIEYKFNLTRGALQIESKDDMRRRGVKSPDFADALMYACADLPIDPAHPVAAVPMGETFQVELEDFMLGESMEISPF